MDNQHKKISGYRDLEQDEIDMMNKVKNLGTTIEDCVSELRSNPVFDQRWVSIGTTDLQTGLMALVRAVARPTTF